jgi:porin
MTWRTLVVPALVLVSALGAIVPALSQTVKGETPDGREIGQGPHGHLLGDWGGQRTRLEERGVAFDLQYVSDSLSNLKSEKKERLTNWNRVRGTVDIDFGALAGWNGLYFHATSVWQGGGNMGPYLGLLTNPAKASANTFRLDSWWLEKRMRNQRIVVRLGQFAGQDFYGEQLYATSFIIEPIGYALGNLSTTFETFDPPSTPAAELRVIPLRWFYVKSMVLAADRSQYAHNPTGFVPQFRGGPLSVSEIGFSLGKDATSVRAFDNVESRNGYSGLYRFGASYNPGQFTDPGAATPRSGNYLLYGIANQALWRLDPRDGKGIDATLAYDWSPADVNRKNRLLIAGLRFNEPLPVAFHNTMSLGYVRWSLSPDFAAANVPRRSEQGVEFNSLLHVLPMMFVQPVIQYYANVGGGAQRALVFGFRVKVEL